MSQAKGGQGGRAGPIGGVRLSPEPLVVQQGASNGL